MNLSRRHFLFCAGAASLAGGCASGRFFTGAAADYDPDLTLFLSDIHLSKGQGGVCYQRDKFAVLVAEILKLNPLPARAVVFGDLARHAGTKDDYVEAVKALKPLRDAGIDITIGMGNHDRRSTFFELFPDHAKRTKLPGRVVSVVEAGAVDFLMLDGLQGTDDRPWGDMGPVPGALDPAQQEWVKDVLPKWKKPVFVCSHFPVEELNVCGKPLSSLLLDAPAVAGYIHGHNHRWYSVPMHRWGKRTVKRSLGLPSTGHWGDIGYALFRTSGDRAEVALRQTEYFFPYPPKAGEMVDRRVWDVICAENQNRTCTFQLPELG